MADRFYGINRAGALTDVTDGSSTTSKHVEAVLDLTKAFEKGEFLRALDLLKNRIVNGDWPMGTVAAAKVALNINRGQVETDISLTQPVAASATATAASVLAADTVTIDGVALTAQNLTNVQTIVCVADVASSLLDTYFKFYVNVAGEQVAYAVRLNVDGAGSLAPVDGAITLHAIVAEDATASQVATAVHAAIDAYATGVTAGVSTTTVTLTNDAIGPVTDSVDGAAAEATSFTLAVTRIGADEPIADSFSIHGTNSDVAASLAAAANASAAAANITASALAAIVTFTANVPGTGGNAITLVSSNGSRLAVTGSGTLASGAAATTGGDVYLTLNTAVSLQRSEALDLIEHIQDYILQGASWPPA